MTPLRVAIVVQGRFHAFDLARGLLANGHDVTVFTNYPRWAAGRFGLDPARVRSAWWHGAAARVSGRLGRVGRGPTAERWLHELFGRWAAHALEGARWDVVHSWSGVSEELLRSPRVQARLKVVMRGSTHIEEQDRLLAEEAARTGVPVARPSPWLVARERREYDLADVVKVLSSYARDSFLTRGFAAERLAMDGLGVDVRTFACPADVHDARASRVARGATLEVLYVGALSAQKGVRDLLRAAHDLEDAPVRFTLVGGATSETQALLQGAGPNVIVAGKVAQARLPAVYRAADVFVFPTLQDGFGVVLTQAMASGLPVIASSHSAAPDLVDEGRTGWVVPPRTPSALTARLRWCLDHRAAFADLIARLGASPPAVDWTVVAQRFAADLQKRLEARETRRS